MGFKNDLPNEGLECSHVAVNDLKVPQPSTIRRARTVIKSVLWFVANGALVAEIWPFQVWQGRGVQIPSLLVVCSWLTLTDSVCTWFARLMKACHMNTCANLVQT